MLYISKGTALATSSTYECCVRAGSYFALEALFALPFAPSNHALTCNSLCEAWVLPRVAFDNFVRDDDPCHECVTLVRSKVRFEQGLGDWVWDEPGRCLFKVIVVRANGLGNADI